MLRIDKAILDTNAVICDNISQLSFADRGLLSQNILGQLRNFVEYIAIKAYSNGKDVDPNDYNLNVAALKDILKNKRIRRPTRIRKRDSDHDGGAETTEAPIQLLRKDHQRIQLSFYGASEQNMPGEGRGTFAPVSV